MNASIMRLETGDEKVNFILRKKNCAFINGKESSDYNLSNNQKYVTNIDEKLLIADDFSIKTSYIYESSKAKNYLRGFKLEVGRTNQKKKKYDIVEIELVKLSDDYSKTIISNPISFVFSEKNEEFDSISYDVYSQYFKNGSLNGFYDLNIVTEDANIVCHLWQQVSDINYVFADKNDFNINIHPNNHYCFDSTFDCDPLKIVRIDSETIKNSIGLITEPGDYALYLFELYLTDENKENRYDLIKKQIYFPSNSGGISYLINDAPEEYYKICKNRYILNAVTNNGKKSYFSYRCQLDGKKKASYNLSALKKYILGYSEKYHDDDVEINMLFDGYAVEGFKIKSDSRYDFVEGYYADSHNENIRYVFSEPLTLCDFYVKEDLYMVDQIPNLKSIAISSMAMFIFILLLRKHISHIVVENSISTLK